MAGSVNSVTVLNHLRARSAIKPDTGCWEWQGCVQGNGYSRLRLGGKSQYGHRVAYEAAHGAIPVGLDVCHRCDNRKCVNPDHLFSGSRKDNMRDAKQKGRLSTGANHPVCRGEKASKAKLTWALVREIRRTAVLGSYPQIAMNYHVSPSTIGLIMRGKIWREGSNA